MLSIPPQYAGQRGKCNNCGGVVLVPNVEPVVVFHAAPEAAVTHEVSVIEKQSDKRSGPFGLWMGMRLDDFEEELTDLGRGKYSADSVPKKHSAFESYVLQITPRCGLSWLKAIGHDVTTSVYGYELQSAFEVMEKKLTAAYGEGEKSDFLMHGSVWDEPREWMQSLLNKERLLMTSWPDKKGPPLPNNLKKVTLIASALETDSGYIAVSYAFENEDQGDAEIAAAEDDAL
jgi:hypothetical protein